MKIISRYAFLIFFVVALFSCAERREIMHEIGRGMYTVANQIEDLKHIDDRSPLDNSRPTYEAYQQDRDAVLNDNKRE